MGIENYTRRQTIYRRGQIFNADMGVNIGSEQSGFRPVVIIQNDIGNKYSPTVIVASITSKIKNNMPTHIELVDKDGLDKDSVVMLEQLRTIDKRRLRRYIGMLNDEEMTQVKKCLNISLALEETKLNQRQQKEFQHIRNELERIDNIICWWIGRGGNLTSIPTEMTEFNLRFKEFNYWVNKYNLSETYDIKYEKMLLKTRIAI